MIVRISIDTDSKKQYIMANITIVNGRMIIKTEGTRMAGQDAYVALARETIEEYIRNGKVLQVPDGLPEEMYTRQAGVFVSIKKKRGKHKNSIETLNQADLAGISGRAQQMQETEEEGELRGCIGTIQAVQRSIAEEIIQNAISASTRDPRFFPIRSEELDRLSISVDVLGELEEVDSLRQLDAKRYGVVVTKGRRRGLLLPNLEGVDTVEDQVAIAKRKAGIGETERVQLQRFEVIRHK